MGEFSSPYARASIKRSRRVQKCRACTGTDSKTTDKQAILSFALKDNQMDIEKTHAFLEGYSQHSFLTMPNIADALRLSWCMEIPWWIQPEFFREDREKVVRFKDEMLWLTEHWNELDSLLCL